MMYWELILDWTVWVMVNIRVVGIISHRTARAAFEFHSFGTYTFQSAVVPTAGLSAVGVSCRNTLSPNSKLEPF